MGRTGGSKMVQIAGKEVPLKDLTKEILGGKYSFALGSVGVVGKLISKIKK
jgi:hypothetical protein